MADLKNRELEGTTPKSREELTVASTLKKKTETQTPYLLLVSGPQKHKKVLLLARETLLGRDSVCHVCLQDPFVSGRHAVIRRSPEAVFIRDLSSANGTIINSTDIRSEKELKDGDRILIGRTELEIRLP